MKIVGNGQYMNMSSLVCELEQRCECWGLERQLEQLSDEFEQQRGLSRGLRLHPQTLNRDSGATGVYCPALSEINQSLLFSRRKPKTRGFYLL